MPPDVASGAVRAIIARFLLLFKANHNVSTDTFD